MKPEYLQLAELIPVSPWKQRDIGMIETCNQTECMYCEIPKEIAHAPDCPWPELEKLAKQMKKEWTEKYGPVKAIRKARWDRNYKPPEPDDYY